ncbi:MAG: FtsX-like permease family protein [Acidobacteriota bacterium]|nr:FtsX-like permease family protein [Acidobacteriota bacterium]
MSHERMLARAFAAGGGAGRLHSSFVVSIASVLLGVAFLVLTLGVYDSYVDKLETIAFALYPHVLLVDGQTLERASSAPEESDRELCERFCNGEVVLGAERWEHRSAGVGVTADRFAELQRALKAADPVDSEVAAVVAPVILEERELTFVLGSRSASVEASLGKPGEGASLGEPRLVRVLGVDPEASRLVPRVDLVLDAQQVDQLKQEPGTVFLASTLWRDILGSEAASDWLRLARPGDLPLALHLGGQFELGFHAVAHNLLITSLDTARSILSLGDEASYLGVVLKDPYQSRDYVDATKAMFHGAGFRAIDWTEVAGGDFESIRLFRWILFLVLGLSFLTIALGIRNTIAILIVERRRHIGILRALGVKDRSLRLIFLVIACAMGLAGAVPGALIGSWMGIAFGHWLDQELAGVLPLRGVEVVWQPVALAQVLSLVLLVCALTSAAAVRRALDLDPATCLREE